MGNNHISEWLVSLVTLGAPCHQATSHTSQPFRRRRISALRFGSPGTTRQDEHHAPENCSKICQVLSVRGPQWPITQLIVSHDGSYV